ncbi:two component transcriptional regulator, winged helix family [Desulfotomaculum arcticum]|uniref:Stage 0 sporulation protein A homolog n=1 Tax=Desulfotruncus arcticus DSM 17038 TaxID=1121424 RepID=A0A1I2NXB8_9FIRM|nr:response regulator transcription factor [Desulfotruncus arcticus]SFG06116.1 two component transcriptional regulator, winged helix family [Desulfotomaculum arcticum] [Desulfotruncus arcticus DSM 17038]
MPEYAGTVLVVEDEEPVRELTRLYLEREGFQVETALDGEEALLRAASARPDLILLDIMLPKMDGWAVCREIRKQLVTPIIMLTARGEELDRVLGLEMGADDYITKPFSPREMVARVKAVLRRVQQTQTRQDNEVITLPGLIIDNSARQVEINGQVIPMPPKEFDLLWFLAGNPGRVFTREQLLQQVWEYDYLGDPRTVDTHIKRLREKLNANTGRRYIKTVWGLGYKFEV